MLPNNIKNALLLWWAIRQIENIVIDVNFTTQPFSLQLLYYDLLQLALTILLYIIFECFKISMEVLEVCVLHASVFL